MTANMPPPTDPQFKISTTLGRAYELFAKRGVLYHLVEMGVIPPDEPALEPWLEFLPSEIAIKLARELDIVDPAGLGMIRLGNDHIAKSAFLSGYCAIRAYLKSMPAVESLDLKFLHCPFEQIEYSFTAEERGRAFFGALGRSFSKENLALTARGLAPNADFLILAENVKNELHLLTIEFSYNVPTSIDFQNETAHITEVARRQNQIDARGVFGRITSEVDGYDFKIASTLSESLGAFTTEDKPLHKLCQASSYAITGAKILTGLLKLKRPIYVRALAVTPNGLESLSATITPGVDFNLQSDPRFRLMGEMAHAYRKQPKLTSAEDLTKTVSSVFDTIAARLPQPLRTDVKNLKIHPGASFSFVSSEEVNDFKTPAAHLSELEQESLVPTDPSLAEHFQESPYEAIKRQVQAPGTLRDLHAAAIDAGLKVVKRGTLNAIALEGNPGIGKTTAVIRHLKKHDQGFLFFYISPRVSINNEVFSSLATNNEGPSGILTLTSNSQLIGSAEAFARENPGVYGPGRVDRAIRVEGVEGLDLKRRGSTIYVSSADDPKLEAILENNERKYQVSNTEDQIVDKRQPSVLKTICGGAGDLLGLRPDITRIAITASIQTMRETQTGKTTVAQLSMLFRNSITKSAGIEERRRFAQRCPLIVVMVDELAGDGAGAPFLHALAEWLDAEFIEPFDGASPFTVVLIPSDASLTSDRILAQYLESEDRAPDKILIAPSEKMTPFSLSARPIKLGGHTMPCLHVMTNSFPAARLTITTKISMRTVDLIDKKTGEPLIAYKAIRDAIAEPQLDDCVTEILHALEQSSEQVIYFAQDKVFLSKVKAKLLATPDIGRLGVYTNKIEILDSSVPQKTRQQLMEPKRRDKIRLFLMTSSGSRGLSFPRATTIIATMPRFNPEAALMELSQLVYRGRGAFTDEDGVKRSHDEDGLRRLVFLIDDAAVQEPGAALDPRAWLRQATDLLTFLVMLRSTLLTRIKGDSGLSNPMALVPVGAVGLEENPNLMSDRLTSFLKESSVALVRNSDDGDDALSGLVRNAHEGARMVFRKTELVGQIGNGRDAFSYSNRDFRAKIAAAALSDPIRGLHLRTANGGRLIPDNLDFAGGLAFERWPEAKTTEAFRIESSSSATDIDGLTKQLYKIKTTEAFSRPLRNSAGSLHSYLAREKSEGLSFRFRKTITSRNLLIVIPIGYDEFVENDVGENVPLRHAQQWLDTLARAFGPNHTVTPVIAEFREFPFAATITTRDPLGITSVFNDKYFSASSEFNLLNCLLVNNV